MRGPSPGLAGILLIAVCGSVAANDLLSDVLKEEPISESQFTPWGNLQGMRVRGEWVAFEAGVRVVRSDWSGFSGAVKYLQRPQYSRAGAQRTVVSSISGVGLRNVLTDTAPGEATLEVEVVAETELEAAGVFLCLDLFNRATALKDPRVDQPFEQPVPGKKDDWQLYLRLLDGATPTGGRAAMRIDLKATAAIEPAPVRLTLDATKPGRRFDGIGGNFRLQFPKSDPAVIRYCLENLPVTWGRNDLPWAAWRSWARSASKAAPRNSCCRRRVM